jgi:hypothetical protein
MFTISKVEKSAFAIILSSWKVKHKLLANRFFFAEAITGKAVDAGTNPLTLLKAELVDSAKCTSILSVPLNNLYNL